MPMFRDSHRIDQIGYRPPGEVDEPPPLMTIGGKTIEQLEQQRQEQARRATLDDGGTDRAYAKLVAVANQQRERLFAIHDKSTRDPQLWTIDRVEAEVYGREPDSQAAKEVAAMKSTVDAVEQAAEVPVVLAQAKVDVIQQSLANTNANADAGQMARQVMARDRALRRLSTAQNQEQRASIARDVLQQAPSRAEVATLLVELQSELSAAGMSDSLIHQVIDPVARQRIPELGEAQDELAERQLDAGITRHTAGVVRKHIMGGTPPDVKVLKMLDPKELRAKRLTQ
jgi:hypothetical protein